MNHHKLHFLNLLLGITLLPLIDIQAGELIPYSPPFVPSPPLHNTSTDQEIFIYLNQDKSRKEFINYIGTLEQLKIPSSQWPSFKINDVGHFKGPERHLLNSHVYRDQLIALHNQTLQRIATEAATTIFVKNPTIDFLKLDYLYQKLLDTFVKISPSNQAAQEKYTVQINPSNKNSLNELLKLIDQLEKMQISLKNWDFALINHKEIVKFERWAATTPVKYYKILKEIQIANQKRHPLNQIQAQSGTSPEVLNQRVEVLEKSSSPQQYAQAIQKKRLLNQIQAKSGTSTEVLNQMVEVLEKSSSPQQYAQAIQKNNPSSPVECLSLSEEDFRKTVLESVKKLVNQGKNGKKKSDIITDFLTVETFPLLKKMIKQEQRSAYKRILKNTLEFNMQKSAEHLSPSGLITPLFYRALKTL